MSMATVIPVLGEMQQIAAPADKAGVHRLVILGGLPSGDIYNGEIWVGDNGDVFVYHLPTTTIHGLKHNIRATKFISLRGGFHQVTGTVVYLSSAEWGSLVQQTVAREFQNTYQGTPHPTVPTVPSTSPQPLIAVRPPSEPTVPIGGKTYPVRHELRALGGQWNEKIKSWVVPQSKEYEARGIVARGPTQAPPPARVPVRHGHSGKGTVLNSDPPGLKVDPNDMAARFASGPRRNMKEGSCYKCGILISRNGGLLLKDPEGRWVVECLPENQASCKGRAFDDSLLEENIPQDPREKAREEEDVPF